MSSCSARDHQGCSVQANQSRRGSSIQWLQQNGTPSSQWERPSHRCYVKCSLAVIPLVTGHGSPVSSSHQRSVHTQQNRLKCIKRHLWVKKKQLLEAASDLAIAQWANHQAATQQTPYHCPVHTQNRFCTSRRGVSGKCPPPHTPKTKILRLIKQVCKINIVLLQQRNVKLLG